MLAKIFDNEPKNKTIPAFENLTDEQVIRINNIIYVAIHNAGGFRQYLPRNIISHLMNGGKITETQYKRLFHVITIWASSRGEYDHVKEKLTRLYEEMTPSNEAFEEALHVMFVEEEELRKDNKIRTDYNHMIDEYDVVGSQIRIAKRGVTIASISLLISICSLIVAFISWKYH